MVGSSAGLAERLANLYAAGILASNPPRSCFTLCDAAEHPRRSHRLSHPLGRRVGADRLLPPMRRRGMALHHFL